MQSIEPIEKILAKKNTAKNTRYGCNHFNGWWATNVHTMIEFPPDKFKDAAFVRTLQEQSGVEGFLVMSHVQRAEILKQFVKTIKSKNGDLHLRAKSIKGIVDGLVREIKLIEGQNDDLLTKYGDWSWKKHCAYVIVVQSLKEVCLQKEVPNAANFRPSQTADVMQFWEFEQCQQLCISKIANSSTFREKLIMTQHYVMQTIGKFCGARAIGEIHDMRTSDFTELDVYWLEYFPSNYGKTVRVKSDFSIAPRFSSFICGRANCDAVRLLCSHRNTDASNYLFLKVLNNVKETEEIWFANQRVGEGKIGKALSPYAEELVTMNVFDKGHYTNTSIRKLVTEVLALKGTPEVIVSSAIGHYSSSGASYEGGFRDSNLGNYMCQWSRPLLRKKIAVMMLKKEVKWADVQDQKFYAEYVAQNSPAGIVIDIHTFKQIVEAAKINLNPAPEPEFTREYCP
jgi:hypothetical protein